VFLLTCCAEVLLKFGIVREERTYSVKEFTSWFAKFDSIDLDTDVTVKRHSAEGVCNSVL
jgi:hypothetical protein